MSRKYKLMKFLYYLCIIDSIINIWFFSSLKNNIDVDLFIYGF